MSGMVPEALEALVQSNMHCVDVGANQGTMTEIMLRLSAPGGVVYAVEPMPKWADALKLRSEYPHRLKVFQNGVAEGIRYGWNVLECDQNPGNAGLTILKGDPVKVVSLDSLLQYASPHLIKIDVEGMELDVMLGAWRTISKHHPILIYETHPEFAEARGQPVFKWIEHMLRDEGYRLYDFRVGQLVEVTSETAGADTIAIHGKTVH